MKNIMELIKELNKQKNNLNSIIILALLTSWIFQTQIKIIMYKSNFNFIAIPFSLPWTDISILIYAIFGLSIVWNLYMEHGKTPSKFSLGIKWSVQMFTYSYIVAYYLSITILILLPYINKNKICQYLQKILYNHSMSNIILISFAGTGILFCIIQIIGFFFVAIDHPLDTVNSKN